jgi:hypothetical protein
MMPESAETIAVAELLLKSGASTKHTCKHCGSPLVTAAREQNVSLVRMMLASQRPEQELLDEALLNTPLTEANPLVELLLANGANINLDSSKYRPGVDSFHPAWSAASGVRHGRNRELLHLLIRYKVDPNKGVNQTNYASTSSWIV